MTPASQTAPLRTPSLRRNLVQALRSSASFAIVALGVLWLSALLKVEPPAIEGTVASEKSAETSPVAALLNKHDCWTGDAPADVEFPGHVVVTQDGLLRYGGQRLVSVALGHVFEKLVPGLLVHGFCS